jgi:hypothetical protein
LIQAAALLLFGFGLLLFGVPFLLIGLGLACAWLVRANRPLSWAIVGGIAALAIVAILVRPLGCTGKVSVDGGVGSTTCSNALGIRYAGGADYNPPLWPAPIAGLAAGLLTAAVTWRLLTLRN